MRADVRPVHREMAAAAGGKNVWIVGGGEPPLRLISVKAVGTGFAELHYEVPARPR